MEEDELACCSNTNVFKFPTVNEKSDVLKRNRIKNQAYSQKLLNGHCRSLSHQLFHTSVTSSRTCSLSFIVLLFAFLSLSDFLVAADRSNFSDPVTELRHFGINNNHSSSRNNSYGATNTQFSSTALRKAYTNQFAVRIRGGDIVEAEKLASKHGFINLGKVCFFMVKFLKNLKNSIRGIIYIDIHRDYKQSLQKCCCVDISNIENSTSVLQFLKSQIPNS